jgi:phosphomannomutase/dTDP-glucose pyrophosphorylase
VSYKEEKMKAIIMAAGEGKRMGDLTNDTPKPMLKIGETPLLNYKLQQLEGIVDEAVIIVGYKKEKIIDFYKDHFTDNNRDVVYRGIKLNFQDQNPTKMGTGAAVESADKFIKPDDRTLVLNGDDFYEKRSIEKIVNTSGSSIAVQNLFKDFPPKSIVESIDDKMATIHEKMPLHFNTGLYCFEYEIFDHLKNLTPSPRGEFELTDAVTSLAKEKGVNTVLIDSYFELTSPADMLKTEQHFKELDIYQKLVESFSGVRGVFGESFTLDTARQYARTYGNWIISQGNLNPSIVIGGDTRPSCKKILDAISDELKQLGCNIINAVINTTPAIEYGVREYKAAGGIIITASHNPKEYNGLKLLQNDSSILDPDNMKWIIDNRKSNIMLKQKNTSPQQLDIQDELTNKYLEDAVNSISGKKRMGEILEFLKKKNIKIYLDPIGGAACNILKELVKEYGLRENCIIVNGTEGDFSGRPIEPNSDNLKGIAGILSKNDLAFCFDCDADRVELAVNSQTEYANKYQNNVVSGQYVMGLLTKKVLEDRIKKGERTHGEKIVVNDPTSNLTRDVASQFFSSVEEVEVGETNVVRKMKELNSPIGGEGSNGGVILKGSKCRDGLLAMLNILDYMVEKDKYLDELLLELPEYYSLSAKEKIHWDRSPYAKQMLEEYFLANKKIGNYTFNRITKTGDNTGGIKVYFKGKHEKDNPWIWYRVSKTEPDTIRMWTDSLEDKARSKELYEMGYQALKDTGLLA